MALFYSFEELKSQLVTKAIMKIDINNPCDIRELIKEVL
jgi:hypothetical protein